MNRRDFNLHFSKLSGGILISPCISFPNRNDAFTRLLPEELTHPDLPFPTEKRVPLGWPVFSVETASSGNEEVRFKFPQVPKQAKNLVFRITSAIDFREHKHFELYLPETGERIGELDCRYAHPFQPFQLDLNKKWIKKINQQGLALKMVEGEKPAWFYRSSDQDNNQGMMPQLLYGKQGDENIFLENLYSMNSFSPFGWMGGSVQDALLELYRQGKKEALITLTLQLEKYLDQQKGIIFENPRTKPMDGSFNSIEDFLPFAAIVARYPDHPSIPKAVAYCLERKNEKGLIATGHITTEACYTLAYPLMEIAKSQQDAALAQVALDQLLFRKQYLSEPEAIYQRAEPDGQTSYRNWGRGVTWYLLGIIKTLRAYQDSDFKNLKGEEELKEEFQNAVQWVARHQNKDGLWYGYLDDPETEIDTSASAGIAAALGWGCQLSLISSNYQVQARKAYHALMNYLTPDGFVTHISQINRGGDELQKSGYRVITQFGMGLTAQLKAALH